MKVLVLGAGGFIGSHVSESLSKKHEVIKSTRGKSSKHDNAVFIDMESQKSIAQALTEVNPEVVINCAGVVENSEKAKLNEIYTANLLQEIVDSKKKIGRVIILGSAAEYGVVENLPVDEDTPLNPANDYGKAKMRETTTALEYKKLHNLPVTVARIFNPIGTGMNKRQLIPSLIRQIEEFKKGKTDYIEVSRLDSKRDYIDVRDIGNAITILTEHDPNEDIYNIGSGKSTSNRKLIETLLSVMKFEHKPELKEYAQEKEPLYAIKADISRMKNEFKWAPLLAVDKTITSIVNGN